MILSITPACGTMLVAVPSKFESGHENFRIGVVRHSGEIFDCR
jgi:hypothetical protein